MLVDEIRWNQIGAIVILEREREREREFIMLFDEMCITKMWSHHIIIAIIYNWFHCQIDAWVL